jgi:transcriptional regulator with XRE-family HTH domain
MTTTTTAVAPPKLRLVPDKNGASSIVADLPRVKATPTEIAGCPAKLHGTRWAISAHGCTCPGAQLAAKRYNKRFSAGVQPSMMIPGIGTNRRLQALAALGWSAVVLAERLGCSHQAVSKLRRRTTVHRATAARVAALYQELSTTTPPPSGGVTLTMAVAARNGWARPDQWLPGEIDDPDARSDLDFQRDDTARAILCYEDVAYLESVWPLPTVTDPKERTQLAYGRDKRIAAHLSRQLGWTVSVNTLQTCRRRALRPKPANTKLTDDDIITIRDRYQRECLTGALTRAELAAAYGVVVSTIDGVLAGRVRPHLHLPNLLDTGQQGGTQHRSTARPPARTRKAS